MSATSRSAPLPSASPGEHPGVEAVRGKGWWRAYKWLLLRRSIQFGLLALFLAGPWLGVWIVKGNLSSSLTLGILPLTDPYLLLQSAAAGHWPLRDALLGGGIVAAIYLLFGGRLYCAWVCPINVVTDAAAWARRKLGLRGGKPPAAQTRYWLLGMTLLASAATGTLAWEWVNPVSMLHRGLVFGFGLSWGVVFAVFLYDLLLASRGWCGHLCPVGAFYGLLGSRGLIRVAAPRRAACNDCMDCFAVCPEPHVIRPALKGIGQTHPLILDKDCTACGRCIDVCSKDVFRLTTRIDRSES